MAANVVLPRHLHVGAGASRELAPLLRQLGVRHPFIVTDPDMVRFNYLKSVTRGLDDAGIPYAVFDRTVPDPTVASVNDGVAELNAGDHDGVVALGGGSPMDSAKAIGHLAVYGGRMRDYKAPTVSDVQAMPLVAIPTTAGTGSEATRFTVITDEETEEKMLCPGAGFCPTAALVDYELTLTMPRRLTADTGVDTLTHAIEAYVSAKHNPFSDGMAQMTITAVSRYLRTAYSQPDNHQARDGMMLAAMRGGMAFSNASVCLVHGMSRPIGAFFHVPHGLSNAMLLPAVTAFSIDAAPERYADCARFMRVAEPDDPDRDACRKLLQELRQLNKDLDVPSPKDYGIDKERFFAVLPTMAEQALASGSPGNNPRIPTADEIVEIYRRAWDGSG